MQAKLLERTKKTGVDDLIIGASASVTALKDMIGRVAKSPVSVMITGPSGSGKELVARAIHAESNRANKPFVAINCGAIPAELIESELFGHERGSFTGANARRIGRFEQANGGTLFLDEIGDMRFDMQVKLLRVLEDGIISRVGGGAGIPVDVRIISATHQNIETAIAENRFREDLYFRLGVIPLAVADLASRVDDIAHLIAHFQNGAQGGKARFDAAGIARLRQHPWPGNVRELRNLVERAGILYPGNTIGAREAEILLGAGRGTVLLLPPVAVPPIPTMPAFETPPDPMLNLPSERAPIDLKAILETMELERIQMALDLADGVISEAARMLTLKRTTLIEKMRKYRVDKSC
jgi:sigma-54 dependent transcriptional regulator, flagellar regulatory protein